MVFKLLKRETMQISLTKKKEDLMVVIKTTLRKMENPTKDRISIHLNNLLRVVPPIVLCNQRIKDAAIIQRILLLTILETKMVQHRNSPMCMMTKKKEKVKFVLNY